MIRNWLVLSLAVAACGDGRIGAINTIPDARPTDAAVPGPRDATPEWDAAAPADAGRVDARSADAPVLPPLPDAATPGGFVHPGILVERGQLDFVKTQIAAGRDPWKRAFDAAGASRFGALGYTPHPRAVVECGSYSNPDVGCSDEKDDATAAYTHALLWYLGGEEAHARKSAEILDAWSAVLTDHTNSNAPLQSAWVASVLPRAADLLRSTYPAFATGGADRFAMLLRDVYLPKVINGSHSNGNWELSMAEATVAISVYLDDRPTFDRALAMWRRRVPAYIYLTTDGATPVLQPGASASSITGYWYNPGRFVDGLIQETCRDFGHVQLGLAAMINAAETARIQGVDLYTEQQARILAGLEFTAQYLDGVPNPGLCGGTFTDLSATEMWEVAYNHYAGRAGSAMPHTANVIAGVRPTGTNHHMVWETLTHAEVR